MSSFCKLSAHKSSAGSIVAVVEGDCGHCFMSPTRCPIVAQLAGSDPWPTSLVFTQFLSSRKDHRSLCARISCECSSTWHPKQPSSQVGQSLPCSIIHRPAHMDAPSHDVGRYRWLLTASANISNTETNGIIDDPLLCRPPCGIGRTVSPSVSTAPSRTDRLQQERRTAYVVACR